METLLEHTAVEHETIGELPAPETDFAGLAAEAAKPVTLEELTARVAALEFTVASLGRDVLNIARHFGRV